MKLPMTGTCQCGGCRYRVASEPIITLVCHCTDCQKLSAGAFSLSVLVDREGFEMLSGELTHYDRETESGAIARCWFCRVCGNRIYHENPAMPEIVRLKPGTLDDTSVLEPAGHVWTKRAQPWVTIPENIPSFETQPDLKTLVSEGLLPAGE